MLVEEEKERRRGCAEERMKGEPWKRSGGIRSTKTPRRKGGKKR